jgi:hypothetical protein
MLSQRFRLERLTCAHRWDTTYEDMFWGSLIGATVTALYIYGAIIHWMMGKIPDNLRLLSWMQAIAFMVYTVGSILLVIVVVVAWLAALKYTIRWIAVHLCALYHTWKRDDPS